MPQGGMSAGTRWGSSGRCRRAIYAYDPDRRLRGQCCNYRGRYGRFRPSGYNPHVVICSAAVQGLGTTYDRLQLRPEYPVFNESGLERIPQRFGPPDLWPSGLGPGYSVYAAPHGRNLAGTDKSEMQPEGINNQNSEGIETYPNELNVLAQADDVNGNGVFDPHGSHGNVHPDAGVFQDHLNLPGYVARDHFYDLSEVEDLTQPNGRTMYVPGGAVSFQQGQQRTYEEQQLLWNLPPGMDAYNPEDPVSQSTVNAPTAARPIGEDNNNNNGPNYMPYAIMAGVGLAAGAAWLLMRKK